MSFESNQEAYKKRLQEKQAALAVKLKEAGIAKVSMYFAWYDDETNLRLVKHFDADGSEIFGGHFWNDLEDCFYGEGYVVFDVNSGTISHPTNVPVVEDSYEEYDDEGGYYEALSWRWA